MSLLFDSPLIDGLDYQDNFITSAEEQALIERLGTIDLAPFRFHGWLGNRKTQSFGWRYDFDDGSFIRGDPIPEWLEPLRTRAEAFAHLSPGDFVQTLVARYDPGAGIGWLGTPAVLRFRQRQATGFKRGSIEIAPRSAYRLSGDARWAWEHRITPSEQLRFSITFRSLSDKGRRIAQG